MTHTTHIAMLLIGLQAPALAHPPMESNPTRRTTSQRRHGRWRVDLVPFGSGPGYHVMRADRAWGQPLTVQRLRQVFVAYHARFPEAGTILVQDLSKRGGGRLKPHQSHRWGWDVDVGMVRKGRQFDRLVPASRWTMDVEKTWWLIHTLVQTGDVQYVFLNKRLVRPLYRYARKQGISKQRLLELFHYPRRDRWGVGIIREEPGHTAHFHVRFVKRRLAEPVI